MVDSMEDSQIGMDTNPTPIPSYSDSRPRPPSIMDPVPCDDITKEPQVRGQSRLHRAYSRTSMASVPLDADRAVGFNMEEELMADFLLLDPPENDIEARKMYNNTLFGFRKWKSHVTSRPISTRSAIVQSLYTDVNKPKSTPALSTVMVPNALYTIVFGWWLALLYILLGCFLYLTWIGQPYAFLCFKLAGYFLWPFGKFVNKLHPALPETLVVHNMANRSAIDSMSESSREYKTNRAVANNSVMFYASERTLLLKEKGDTQSTSRCLPWVTASKVLWLVLAVPILMLVHALVFGVTWFLIFTIPIAKINSKTMKVILFMDPSTVYIGTETPESKPSEIVLFIQQSVNWYYYKYTVDGVNVIFANLLIFVIISIVIGYVDYDDKICQPALKCALCLLAILPITYYIGMAITSISAQSNFAVGAFLNATFGSIVEVVLYIIMLKKGQDTGETCFAELVKSTLTGTIICCILLVPGMSMVVGGLKYRHQHFNLRSTNVSSSLLFVAIVGVFAPTIFANLYGNFECLNCEVTNPHNATGFLCSACKTVILGPDDDRSLYNAHIRPLIYACALILPCSYLIGLVFFMKTHNAHIFEEFEKAQKETGKLASHHGIAQWSRLKSTVILVLSVTAISLCSDIISVNIRALLNISHLSEYFVGVFLLSIISMLPEIVNGVQFAAQNNVNLSIEIGSAAAIQVCMVQLPILILADIIYPLGFMAVFNTIHLWVVVFSVIIINYVLQDGKSDYFQGSIVLFIYVFLMLMYFFTVTPSVAICKGE